MPARTTPALPPDISMQPVVIAGGGIIGLSIALELARRGVRATVFERGRAMEQASWAAAGMLAAEDPHNPPGLRDISKYSKDLYPDFLARIESLSGLAVPIQTRIAVQHGIDGSRTRLEEMSLDPRQLAVALLAATRAADVHLREESPMEDSNLKRLTKVMAAGAWAGKLSPEGRVPVSPRKGQMLRVALPEELRALGEVHRSEAVYVVPRTAGPQAGTAVIGATVEDAGFDTATHADDLERLRALAAELLPALSDEQAAPIVEAWAGLRPATPDMLPVIGRDGDVLWATGHFRNGILLAPATAQIVADLIEGKEPVVTLDAFAPQRFRAS
ncbi:FAD-dependent oxidoreductase [Granulicella sp. 5B5]|uniref:NAD(P)/FAD-dependent oxidoreductase n=1 Tax=Granulicella sp. 5B5 TaxID=1617967 RepID=UPI0015F6E942|nr:FAD-dependent oxidoreductase [Granulicella sp. 5B5]QMV19829.1 FAD-dependent oxidoreductase [Granulicella sp. 5B5]